MAPAYDGRRLGLLIYRETSCTFTKLAITLHGIRNRNNSIDHRMGRGWAADRRACASRTLLRD